MEVNRTYVEIVASILREPVWRRLKNFVVFLHRGSYPFNKAYIRGFFLLDIIILQVTKSVRLIIFQL